MRYIERDIRPTLERVSKEYPVVTIFGPRQSGKTTLTRTVFPSYSYANLEDYSTRALAKEDPYEFFTKYPEPVIIDEIQEAPQLLDQIQVRCDQRGVPGQYILIGSRQVALRESVNQSLAGRTVILRLMPLSLHELEIAGIHVDRDAQILGGFMPGLYHGTPHIPYEYYKAYTETYLQRDIAQRRITDLDRFFRFLQLLAGRTGQLVNYTDIANNLGISSMTVKDWISLLETSFVIVRLSPWFPSRDKQIIKTPKLYFCDTGLVCYLLGIDSKQMVRNDRIHGCLFENMVVMEAFKTCLSQNREPSLFFFRNTSGVEVDLLHAPTQNVLIPYEIKSSQVVNKEFHTSMGKFEKLYPQKVFHDHTVIYSGEDIPCFNGVRYCDYRHCADLFLPTEAPFVFNP